MKWQTSKYGWLLGHVAVLPPGQAHLATRGAEFECLPESFRSYIYAAAVEKGCRATTIVVAGSVVYAFYRDTDYMRPNLPAYPVVKKMRRG